MTAIIDDAMIKELEASFIARNDQIIRWSDAISQMQMLPGLRGLWPMSAFASGGNAYDLSGNVRTLTYNGNPTYNYDQYGRVPYIDLDGTGDFLSRGDEAGLDILGNESYVGAAAQGLTLGGWFYFNNVASAQEVLISKSDGWWNNTGYWLERQGAGTTRFRISDGAVTFPGADSSVVIGSGTWNFLVGRFKPSASVDLYQNGIKYSNVTSIPATLVNSSSPLNIGGYNSNGLLLLTGRATLCFLCTCGITDGIISSLYNSQKHFFGV